MGYNDPRQQAVRIVSLSFGLASFVCSSLTLLLIHMMKVQNGYLLILLTMTLAQLMYDVNYILRVDSHNDSTCYASQFLDLVGGLSVSFWVNILSYSVTYTIVRCQSVEVFKHYWLFSLFGTVLPLCIGIIAVSAPQVLDVSDDDGSGCGFQDTTQATFVINFYYWGRLISVMFTTVLCVYNFIKLRDITSSGDNVGFNNQHDIKVVAKVHDYNNMYRTIYRMNFYAVAQIVCRSGAAWNEWDNGRYSSFASEIAAAVCSPSLGICNFLIFVCMQPRAWDNLILILCCGKKFLVESDRNFSRDTVGSQIMVGTLSETLDQDVFNSLYMSDSTGNSLGGTSFGRHLGSLVGPGGLSMGDREEGGQQNQDEDRAQGVSVAVSTNNSFFNSMVAAEAPRFNSNVVNDANSAL